MSRLCDHCQLPVPPSLAATAEAQGAPHAFCCAGCEMVFQILRDQGAAPLYKRAQDARVIPDPRAASTSNYQSFDSPTFTALHCQALPQGLLEVELYIEGVHCAACVWLLEKLPSLCEGVYEARLQFRRSLLKVVWSPEKVSLSRIALILERLGYPPHPYRDLHHQRQHASEDRKMLIRIGLAGAVAGNSMLLAFALYGGLFGGMSADFETYFRWVSLLVALPAVLWASQPFFRGAFAALLTRTLHMDLPIAIGISVGFVSSVWNTLQGQGEIYFDSVTTLIFLLLVGRWLQRRQQRHAAEATELMYQLAPAEARLWQDGRVVLVPVEELQTGDIVEVRAGDTFPVDGVVSSGTSQVDRSLLSGESRPIKAGLGAEVFAGSLNVASALQVKVSKTGHDTRLGQLLATVEEASQQRAPIVQMADRIAGVFTAVVLCLAVGTWFFWWWQGSSAALSHATALLIITCPCALGMATPLAISAALGQAAQQGILIKGGEVLEALALPGRLWLDKTGTLTAGKMSLVSWHGDTTIQPTVREIEQQCVHPIATALIQALPGAETPAEIQIQQEVGRGLEASVDGALWHIGSPEFALAHSHADALPGWWEDALGGLLAQALTPVAVVVDGELKALAGLGDALQPGVAETLGRLQHQGWQVGILSGDHPAVVDAIAAALSLPPEDCHGGLSPEEKQAFVQSSSRIGNVVMVGDGVNDAPALAAATVGVGVRGGAEAALTVADVYLAESGAQGLEQLMQGALRTRHAILRNFAFSLLFNGIGVSMAVAGLITPLWAAILMPLSSLTVIFHSFRSRTFVAIPSDVPTTPTLTTTSHPLPNTLPG